MACALAGVVPYRKLPLLDGRIFGGEDTTIDKHPWQVSLQNKGQHFCGGSLYSDNIVITAAHCVEGLPPFGIEVRVGCTKYNESGQLVTGLVYKFHEKFSRKGLMYDIAVLRLNSSVTFNQNVSTIELATETPSSNESAIISGWGETDVQTFPLILQSTNMLTLSRDDCSKSIYGYGSGIKPTMICAYAVGKISCHGDSGGPLVVNNRLAGVVSWGVGCYYPSYPTVYADVAYLRPWILRTIEELLAV